MRARHGPEHEVTDLKVGAGVHAGAAWALGLAVAGARQRAAACAGPGWRQRSSPCPRRWWGRSRPRRASGSEAAAPGLPRATSRAPDRGSQSGSGPRSADAGRELGADHPRAPGPVRGGRGLRGPGSRWPLAGWPADGRWRGRGCSWGRWVVATTEIASEQTTVRGARRRAVSAGAARGMGSQAAAGGRSLGSVGGGAACACAATSATSRRVRGDGAELGAALGGDCSKRSGGRLRAGGELGNGGNGAEGPSDGAVGIRPGYRGAARPLRTPRCTPPIGPCAPPPHAPRARRPHGCRSGVDPPAAPSCAPLCSAQDCSARSLAASPPPPPAVARALRFNGPLVAAARAPSPLAPPLCGGATSELPRCCRNAAGGLSERCRRAVGTLWASRNRVASE
jgi:hypothetical protein